MAGAHAPNMAMREMRVVADMIFSPDIFGRIFEPFFLYL
jgi:hypothetical protein